MELVTGLVTREKIIDLEDPEESKDVMMLLALNRVEGKGVFHGTSQGIRSSKRSLWDDDVVGYH